MEAPKLCKKHFYEVAGLFDKDVAFEYHVDGDSCLICEKVIHREEARVYAENWKEPGSGFTPRASGD